MKDRLIALVSIIIDKAWRPKDITLERRKSLLKNQAKLCLSQVLHTVGGRRAPAIPSQKALAYIINQIYYKTDRSTTFYVWFEAVSISYACWLC